MGKRSIKENKNIYQLSREEMELTREQAAEKMMYISADRIEKIESEKSIPHPEEVLTMGEAYEKPELWNYFCTHECPIGQIHVPVIEMKQLPQITLELLNAMNMLEIERDRLVEITVDGKITQDERKDFAKISQELDRISGAVSEMKLWVDKAMIDGSFEG